MKFLQRIATKQECLDAVAAMRMSSLFSGYNFQSDNWLRFAKIAGEPIRHSWQSGQVRIEASGIFVYHHTEKAQNLWCRLLYLARIQRPIMTLQLTFEPWFFLNFFHSETSQCLIWLIDLSPVTVDRYFKIYGSPFLTINFNLTI